MDRSVKNSIVAGLATFTIVATVLMPSVSVSATPNTDNITICHATGSTQNPYTVQTISKDSILNDDGHGQGGINDGDIVPAFDAYLGQNWDVNGQAIWNNNCVVPTPTTSTSPSPSTSVIPSTSPSTDPDPVLGCTDSLASNYNPAATQDDQSCTYPTASPSTSPTANPSPSTSVIPSSSPSVSPSSEPTLTPTPSDTPTPTPTPNHHHSGGSSLVESPTPSPSVEPTEMPVVLGANTQLPATGLSVIDALVISLCAGLFAAGAMLAFSSVDTKHLFAPLR